MKIGILGGTFDPVHIGHTALALEAWHRLSLDKVLFVPANRSPFKPDQTGAFPADRLNMLRLAVGHDPRFSISTLELDRGGISYTVDTLSRLISDHEPGTEFFLLVGGDSANGIKKWKDYVRLREMASIVCVPRPGTDTEDLPREDILFLEMPLLEISSTMIRERVKERMPIDVFLCPAVAEYIRNKGLYREEV